jgi:hypothetical protein
MFQDRYDSISSLFNEPLGTFFIMLPKVNFVKQNRAAQNQFPQVFTALF